MTAFAFLSPQQRLPRRPLLPWAQEWTGWLNSIAIANAPPEDLATCLNQLALIDFYLGNAARAETLCYDQIRWVDHLASKMARRGLLRIAFDPWINLGRIFRTTGRWQSAIDNFRIVQSLDQRLSLAIGSIQITCNDWTAICDEDASLRRRLEQIYVLETLKTLLQFAHHEQVDEFLLTLTDLPESLLPFIREARIASLLASEQFQMGMHLAASYINETSGWERLVHATRLAQFMRARELPGNRELIASVFDGVRHSDPALFDLSHVHLAHMATKMALSCKLPNDEIQLFGRLLLNCATKLDDEPLVLEILQTLASASEGNQRTMYCRLQHEAERRSLYSIGRSGTTGDHCVLDAVITQVTQSIYRIVQLQGSV